MKKMQLKVSSACPISGKLILLGVSYPADTDDLLTVVPRDFGV